MKFNPRPIIFKYENWNDFEKYLNKLPDKDAAKLLATINRIQMYGIEISRQIQWIKKFKSHNLFEIRSSFNNNIQRVIYFHEVNNTYVITHGFTKKTQKTPSAELKKGERIKIRYKKNLHKKGI